MNRLLIAFASATLCAVLAAPSVAAFTPQTAAASQAIQWLHSQQSADGTVAGDSSRTEETVWGLAANGASIAGFATGGQTTIDSLRSHIASEEKSAGNIASLVLAVAAANLQPTNFADRNLLQDLACTYNPGTGAYNEQVFNDALAVLAIPAGAAPAKAISFLTNAQQADGGWEFTPGSGSDTNTTALALMALKLQDGLSSTVTSRALAYLKSQQQTSGGFEYTAGTGDSDPDSDGLVIEGLLAVGQDPTGVAWSIGEKNALTDLLTFQYSTGGFGYYRPGSNASAAPDPLSTTQPLVALASTSLPVRAVTGTMPTSCPATAPSTQPTSTPSATPTSPPSAPGRLAQTGGSPLSSIALLLLAIGMMRLGWRLRRRPH